MSEHPNHQAQLNRPLQKTAAQGHASRVTMRIIQLRARRMGLLLPQRQQLQARVYPVRRPQSRRQAQLRLATLHRRQQS